MKTHFLSFADRRFSSDRIYYEAKSCGWFDEVHICDETIFEKWYYNKYRRRFSDRGYGYWQWKSYLIRRLLEKIEEDDVIVYADAGCHINIDGEQRFKEYLSLTEGSDTGLLTFRQGFRESEYSKGDIFGYLGVYGNKLFEEHPQVCAGILFIRKCEKSVSLIDRWYYICHNHYNLINDTPSALPNSESFIENRHDQSVFSMLCMEYDVPYVSDNEVYSTAWESMGAYPIWAARDKTMKLSWYIKLYKRIKLILGR